MLMLIIVLQIKIVVLTLDYYKRDKTTHCMQKNSEKMHVISRKIRSLV